MKDSDPSSCQENLPSAGMLDWLLTIPFLLAFAGILVFFDVVQRLAILVSRRWHELAVTGLNRSLTWSLRLTGTRLLVDGVADVPEGRPLVIISNHQSMFDIPVLCAVFTRFHPRFVAKIELSRWIPSVSFNLRHGGSALIDRSNPRQAVAEIKRFAQGLLEYKFAAVLFPEGTRAKDGVLKRFRTAGLATLLQSVPDAVVLPVALDGTWKLTARKCLPVPCGVTVRVAVGKTIDTREVPKTQQIADLGYQFVLQRLTEFRGTASLEQAPVEEAAGNG